MFGGAQKSKRHKPVCGGIWDEPTQKQSTVLKIRLKRESGAQARELNVLVPG